MENKVWLLMVGAFEDELYPCAVYPSKEEAKKAAEDTASPYTKVRAIPFFSKDDK